jgi:thiol-disulfide isomerase/thioredoxin
LLEIEAWLWPPVKETAPHEGGKESKGIPINESALRDVDASGIRQQVLVFATGCAPCYTHAFSHRHEVSWIAGFGRGGQRLVIVPAPELVCVVKHYDNHGMAAAPDLHQYVLPALL